MTTAMFRTLLFTCLCISMLGITPGNKSRAKAQNVRSIELANIVTTSPQKELRPVREALRKKNNSKKMDGGNGYLRQILSAPGGSSNVFLVDATNADDAIAASFRIIAGSGPADIPPPVNTPDPLRGSHWLVVYLGSGPSNPTWWNVESVTVEGEIVTFSYRKSPPSSATKDLHRYYYWTDLGQLDPDNYELRLFDAERETTTLMRRVEVKTIHD